MTRAAEILAVCPLTSQISTGVTVFPDQLVDQHFADLIEHAIHFGQSWIRVKCGPEGPAYESVELVDTWVQTITFRQPRPVVIEIGNEIWAPSPFYGNPLRTAVQRAIDTFAAVFEARPHLPELHDLVTSLPQDEK